MSSSDFTITHCNNLATLSARIKGVFLPLVISGNISQLEGIYQNILSGSYKNTHELCQEIHHTFASQVTVVVLATLAAQKPIAAIPAK